MCCTAYVPSAIRKQTSSTSCPWNSRSTSGVKAARSSVTTIRAPVSTRAGERRLLDDRPATDVPAAPVGDRSSHLLLEREEEPGRDDEHEDPQSVERRVLGLVERLEGEDLEPVRREARDHQPEADRIRAFGQRHLAGRVDDALCALRHSQVPSGPSGAPGTARCGRASASSIPVRPPQPGTDGRANGRHRTGRATMHQ